MLTKEQNKRLEQLIRRASLEYQFSLDGDKFNKTFQNEAMKALNKLIQAVFWQRL